MRCLLFLMLGVLSLPVFAQQSDASILGEWTLFAFRNTEKGNFVYPPTELHRPIKLYFQEDSSFNANSFRVYISGKFSTNGSAISLTPTNSSKNLAENKLGEKFRETFGKAEKFKLSGDSLVLTCDGGKRKLFLLAGNERTDALYKEHTANLATFKVQEIFRRFFTPAESEGFWVYKDGANNTLQSLYLEKYSHSYFRKNFTDHNREWIRMGIHSDNKQEPVYAAQFYAYADNEVIFKLFVPGTSTKLSATDRCLEDRSAFELDGQTLYGCGCQLEAVEELEVNGKQYQNIIKVTTNDALQKQGLFQSAWFAEGIGLIRHDSGKGASHGLVRHTVK